MITANTLEHLLYSTGLVSLMLILNLSNSHTFIQDLNARLNQFGICDIRITSKFSNTEFEPFYVPVTLVDVKYRTNFTLFKYVWQPITPKLSYDLQYKYRITLCVLDLVLHLGFETYNETQYRHAYFYRKYEYMDEKYLVIIRQHATFLTENHTRVWEKARIIDHRIFIWTLKRSF